MKRLYLIILMLCACYTYSSAQDLTNTLIKQPIKTAEKMVKRTRGIIGTVGWLLNDLDSTYVEPNHYNYTLMIENSNWYEFYQFNNTPDKAEGEHAQRMVFTPNPHYKLGGYFGWSFLFLGWAMDMQQLLDGKKQESNQTEFQLNVYSAILGADIYYRKSGNTFKLHDLKGFGPNYDGSYNAQTIDALNVEMRGINTYWVFNHRRFSYPAAYSQSTNQRHSAGSFIAGFSYSQHKFELNVDNLPDTIRALTEKSLNINKIKYTDYSVNFGYAYNWVFAKNCLASLSVAPAIAYKITKTQSEDEVVPASRRINFDLTTRGGIVWNNGIYYAGASLVANTYSYRGKNFTLNNGFGTLRIYAGFNFGKKRKYE